MFFFPQCPAVLKDGMAVSVDSQRNAMALYDVLKEEQVALGILLIAEKRGGDGTSGIVNRKQESELWSPAHKPIMRNPIQ